MSFLIFLFAMFVLLLMVTVVGHGIWVLCAAFGKAIGLFPETPPATPPQLHRPSLREGFLTGLMRLKQFGHVDEAEYNRLFKLADQLSVLRPSSSPTRTERPAAAATSPVSTAAPPAPVVPPRTAVSVPASTTPTAASVGSDEIYVATVVDSSGPPMPNREVSASAREPLHPLDRPDEPAVAPPRKRFQPRRQLGEIVESFLNKHNIRWGELIAGLLIIVCSIGLVISLWSTLSQTNKMIPAVLLMTGTAAIEGAGLYTLRRWRLRGTSRSVLIIASLLVPLNVVAAISLAGGGDRPIELASPLALATIAVSAVVYTGLMIPAGAALLGRDAWRWVVAVIGPSSVLLVIPHAVQAFPQMAALSLLAPSAALAASVSGWRDPLRRIATGGQLQRYLLLWGIALFGAATCLFFFASQVDLTRMQLNWIAIALTPLVIFAGTCSVNVRQIAGRMTQAWLPIAATTSVLLAGLALAGSMVLAWPTVATAIAWSTVTLLTCGLLALRDRNPVLLHGCFAAVTVALFTIVPQAVEPSGWFEFVPLRDRLLIPHAAATAGGLFTVFLVATAIASGWQTQACSRVDALITPFRRLTWRRPDACWAVALGLVWTGLTATVLLIAGPTLSIGWTTVLLAMLLLQVAIAFVASTFFARVFHVAALLCAVAAAHFGRAGTTWDVAFNESMLTLATNINLFTLYGVALLAAIARKLDDREGLRQNSRAWVVGLCGLMIGVAALWLPESLLSAAGVLALATITLLGLGLYDRIGALVEASGWIGIAATLLYAVEAQFLQWFESAAFSDGRILWQFAIVVGSYSLVWSFVRQVGRAVLVREADSATREPSVIAVSAFAGTASVALAAMWLFARAVPEMTAQLSTPDSWSLATTQRINLPIGLLAGCIALAAAGIRSVCIQQKPGGVRLGVVSRPAVHGLAVAAALCWVATAVVLAVPLWTAPIVVFFVAVALGIAYQFAVRCNVVRSRVPDKVRGGAAHAGLVGAAAVALPLMVLIVSAGVVWPFAKGSYIAGSFWLAEVALFSVAKLFAVSAVLSGKSVHRQCSRVLVIVGVMLANHAWHIAGAGTLTPATWIVETAAGIGLGLWGVVLGEWCWGRLVAGPLRGWLDRIPGPLRIERDAEARSGMTESGTWADGSGWIGQTELGRVGLLAAGFALFVSAMTSAAVLMIPGSASLPISIFTTPACSAMSVAFVAACLGVIGYEVRQWAQKEPMRSAIWSVVQRPWLVAILLCSAGPLAAWGAALGVSSAWTIWIGVLAAASLLTTGVACVSRLRGSEDAVYFLYRVGWVLAVGLLAVAVWGAMQWVPVQHVYALAAVGGITAFSLAFGCRNGLLSHWPALMAAALTAFAAGVVSWVSAIGLMGGPWLLELAFIVGCVWGLESLLWRIRCLAGRDDSPPSRFRADAALFLASAVVGLLAVWSYAAFESGRSLWIGMELGYWPWFFALLTLIGTLLALLRSDQRGQTIAALLAGGFLALSLLGAFAASHPSIVVPLQLPLVVVSLGVSGVILMWRANDVGRLRHLMPRFRDAAPAQLEAFQAQFLSEFGFVMGASGPLVALAAFAAALNANDSMAASAWIWITALIVWGLSIAGAATRGRLEWLRSECVLLMIIAVYAGTLVGLPPMVEAAVVIGSVRVVVVSLAMAAVLNYVVGRGFGLQTAEWSVALRGGVSAVVTVAIVGAGALLFTEVTFREANGIVQMPSEVVVIGAAMIGAMAAALFVFSLRGRIGGLYPQPLGLAVRQGGIYAGQAVALLAGWHIFLCRPEWVDFGLREAWPWGAMAIAFGATALATVAERRGSQVLVGPLTNNALLIPVVGIWLSASETNVLRMTSLPEVGVMLLATLHYGVLAFIGRGKVLAKVLSILCANAAVWIWLATQPGWGLLEHPQAWIIPPVVCVLLAIHLERDRLPCGMVTSARYTGTLIIYVVSTADMLIQQIGSTISGPMILIVLSLLGMGLGVVLRVRPFLYLGGAFLLVSLISMVWYAQQAIDQVWPWWAFGISMGIALLVGLTLLERHRSQVQRIADRLRHWEG